MQIKANKAEKLDDILGQEIRKQLINEQKKSRRLEEKVVELQKSVDEMNDNLQALVELITEYVITSTLSADEIGQRILYKFKKRKLRHKKNL